MKRRKTLPAPLVFLLLFSMADSGFAQPAGTPGSGDRRTREVDELETFELGEIVISDRRRPNIEQAGTTTVITSKDLDRHGVKTLPEALSLVPGIELERWRKGSVRIRLRGYSQDKVMILVDGVPLNDIFSTDVDAGSIPIHAISKIVVNRGVSSALYGTDGAVGTINIISRRPRRATAGARMEYGSNNNSLVGLNHGNRLGRFHYGLSGLIEHSGGFKPSARLDAAARRRWFDNIIRYDLYPASGGPFGDGPRATFDDLLFPGKAQYINDGGVWDHQDFTRFSGSARAGYTARQGWETGATLSYTFYSGRTNTYQPSPWNSYRGNQWRSSYPCFGGDQANVKKFALRNRAFVWPEISRLMAAPWFRLKRGRLDLRLLLHLHRYHTEQEGYADTGHELVKSDSLLLKKTGVFEPFQDRKTFTSLGLRLTPSWRFSDWHRLTVAIQFRHDDYLGEEMALSPELSPETWALKGDDPYPIEDLGAQRFSLAVEDEVKLFGSLKLVGGVSYDMQNLSRIRLRENETMGDTYKVRNEATLFGTRDAVNPTAGLVWEPLRRRLRFRTAGALKTRFPTLSEYAKVATDDQDRGLKPERAWNGNAGAELFFMDRAISLRTDVFASVVDDRIVKIHRDEPPVNVDRVVSWGFESGAAIRLRRPLPFMDLRIGLNHVWTHARNMDDSPSDSVNKGPWIEFTPVHHLSGDLQLDFTSGTRVTFWGRATIDQRFYVMDEAVPSQDAPYSTDYYTTIRLHDPIFLNLQVGQRLWKRFELTARCTNILDDYEADPFAPGSGRMFFLGASAEL